MPKKKKINNLNYKSQVTTLALKFYSEQLMVGDERQKYSDLRAKLDTIPETVVAYSTCKHAILVMETTANQRLAEKIKKVDRGRWSVYAVYHNRDTKRSPDDLYEISTKKGHWHLYIWRNGEDSGRRSRPRFRIGSVLSHFGIYFEGKADQKLWDNRGAELIRADVCASIAYALHETRQAIADGKAPYKISEIVTNQPKETIEAYLQKYRKISAKKKNIDWEMLYASCYKLGLECGDVSRYLESTLSVSNLATREATLCRKKYEEGLAIGVGRIPSITRCSILIHGAGDLGKSYTTRKTLRDLVPEVYIASKGSGKYDGLRPTAGAMIFDDIFPSDARNVFDNSAVILHRRNSGDRPWLGTYAVATTNSIPLSWFASSVGTHKYVETQSDFDDLYKSEKQAVSALRSRMYVCTIVPYASKGQFVLKLERKQTRGTAQAQAEHDEMFEKFKKTFDEYLFDFDPGQYHPLIQAMDPGEQNRFWDVRDWRIRQRNVLKAMGSGLKVMEG